MYTDDLGTAFSAALLLINPKGTANQCCKLEILTTMTASTRGLYLLRCHSGNVGDPELNGVCESWKMLDPNDDERWCKLRSTIPEFRKKFKDLTGLEWRHRFNQPHKAKYTFIPDHYEGFARCDSKPL